MRFHDYEPKIQKNPLLICSSAISVAAAAALWYYKDELSLSVSDLLMLSGIALFILLLTIRDILKKKENFLKASELKKQREDMADEDFSDNSIFYD